VTALAGRTSLVIAERGTHDELLAAGKLHHHHLQRRRRNDLAQPACR
jgi:hypothetical protein